MPSDRLPSFGDVITSKKFRYGQLGSDGNPPIQVGQDSPKHLVSKREITYDIGVPDESRATAEFVVINCAYEGGGTAMGHDVYPDGWHIVAKRLDKDGKWDPNGEEIAFYMTGFFIDMIPPEEVKIVRHMAMHYI